MDIAAAAASSAISSSPLYLHISIYVTCLCNPDAVPPIPDCDVVFLKPSVHQILQRLVNPPTGGSDPVSTPSPPNEAGSTTEIVVVDEEADIPSVSRKLPWIKPGGGVAVCASGPAGLTTEAANAVSRIQLSGRGKEVGRIGLHTEVFAL
jgi:hypothetical protein